MQPHAPLLTIIIVAFKSRHEICGCLASIPRVLNGRDVEVIVVDNSPGDGAGEIVRRDFLWVKYIELMSNLGFGRASNLGYSRCNPTSEFVLFLNPDTVCNEEALTTCVVRLLADPSIGLISPKLVLADGTMDLACRRSIPSLWDGFCRAVGLAAAFPRSKLFSGYNLTYLDDDGVHEVGAINGAFMMGRRSVFDAVAAANCLPPSAPVAIAGASQPNASSLKPKASNLPPPAYSLQPSASSKTSPCVFDDAFFMYGDDLDLCIRVAKAGWRIVYDGSVSITHLKGLSVAKDYDLMSRAIFDANRDVYLKHFNPRNSRWVRWKYQAAFAAWKYVARWRAALREHRRVRPL